MKLKLFHIGKLPKDYGEPDFHVRTRGSPESLGSTSEEPAANYSPVYNMHHKLDPRFLKYAFEYAKVSGRLQAHGSGTTRLVGISHKDLHSVVTDILTRKSEAVVQEDYDHEERKLRLRRLLDKSRLLRTASGMASKAGAGKKSAHLWFKSQRALHIARSKDPTEIKPRQKFFKDMAALNRKNQKKNEAYNRMQRLTKATTLLSNKLMAKHGLDYLFVRNSNIPTQAQDRIHVYELSVPKSMRKQGRGSGAMKDVTAFADRHKLTTTLDLAHKDPISGTTSKERLRKFYGRFGFKSNRGRNKDYTTQATMIRKPKAESIAKPIWFTGEPDRRARLRKLLATAKTLKQKATSLADTAHDAHMKSWKLATGAFGQLDLPDYEWGKLRTKVKSLDSISQDRSTQATSAWRKSKVLKAMVRKHIVAKTFRNSGHNGEVRNKQAQSVKMNKWLLKHGS